MLSNTSPARIAATVLIGFALIGCGGEADMEELEKRFERDLRASQVALFRGTIPAAAIGLADKPYSPPVGRQALGAQIAANRRSIAILSSAEVPEDAAQPVNELISILERDTEELRRAVDDHPLSRAEFYDAICCTPEGLQRALDELGELGYRLRPLLD